MMKRLFIIKSFFGFATKRHSSVFVEAIFGLLKPKSLELETLEYSSRFIKGIIY